MEPVREDHEHEHEHEHEHCCREEHGHEEHEHGCCHEEHDHDHEHEHDHGHRHHEHNDGLTCGCGHCHDRDHHHDHDHGHSHGHDHEHGEHSEEEEKREKLEILIGAVLFAGAVAVKLILGLETYTWPFIVVFVLAYLVLGRNVLREAFESLTHGGFLDENFLMSVATIGAFAIQNYPEAVGVMLFFRIGEAFEDAAVEKSRRRISETLDLRPETVTVEEDGAQRTIPAEEAEPGMILIVRPGDRVPLDGTVLEGESFLDNSAITGEPVPVSVRPGDSVFSGGINTQGLLKLRADKPLGESMVSRILESVENAAETKPKIDRFISRFARVYTPIVVGLALFTAIVIPLLRGEPFRPWIYTAISFLVMSCPCALVLSVPLAFYCAIGRASSRGILFKGGAAVEALAGVKAAVMDKTGTLTRGEFEVKKLLPAEGVSDKQLLLLAAAAEQPSTHPIAHSILRAAEKAGVTLPAVTEMEEYSGKGIRAEAGGKTVLCGNRKLMDAFGVVLPELPAPETPGATTVYAAADGVFLGRLEIADGLKEGAAEAVARLTQQGLTPVMLTGDGESSAKAVAETAGIGNVRAGLLPEEKLSALQEIRREIGGALFVGDGINDAPVLAGADVGAAMGSGADAAIEAADLVFMNSDVAAVPEAVDTARRAMRIARENVIFALAVKGIVMILGITGIFSNMWLAVFADTGVALLCILNSVRLLGGRKKN